MQKRQGFIDDALRRVEMRREANAAATQGADDLRRLQPLEERCIVPAMQAEGEDAGPTLGCCRRQDVDPAQIA